MDKCISIKDWTTKFTSLFHLEYGGKTQHIINKQYT